MAFDLSTLGPLAGSLIKAGAPTLGSVVGTLVGGPFGTIAGGLAGNVLADIAGALGAPPDAPPEVIAKTIETDPDAAATRLQTLEDDYKTEIEDRQNARQQTVDLAKAGSEVAWGAPVVSVIATLGFFVTAWLGVTSHAFDTPMGNLIMGGMLTGYSTVLAYWLGSSSAARRNGDAIRAIAQGPRAWPATTVRTPRVRR